MVKRASLSLVVLLSFWTAVSAQEAKSRIPQYLSLSGFIEGQFTCDDAQNTFFIRRARVLLGGEVLPDLEFKLQAEMAGSAPRMLDAYFKYKFRPYLNVQVGQFKTPFTLESQYPLLKKEGIDYAQVIAKLAGYGDVLGGNRSNARDIGLMLYGNMLMVGQSNPFPLLSYNVGLFNGPGINRKDDNRTKDIIARFDVRPFVRNLVLSASVVAGSYNDGVTADAANNRFSFGGEYKDESLTVRSEYVRADIEGAGIIDGYYAVAGYWFDLPLGQRLRPIVRYDTYNNAGTVTTLCMAGLDWWPLSHLRLQFNCTRAYDPAPASPRNVFQVMASVRY